jgi:hypothetical protein
VIVTCKYKTNFHGDKHAKMDIVPSVRDGNLVEPVSETHDRESGISTPMNDDRNGTVKQ